MLVVKTFTVENIKLRVYLIIGWGECRVGGGGVRRRLYGEGLKVRGARWVGWWGEG